MAAAAARAMGLRLRGAALPAARPAPCTAASPAAASSLPRRAAAPAAAAPLAAAPLAAALRAPPAGAALGFLWRRFVGGEAHNVVANGDIPFNRVRVVDDRGLVGDFQLSEALVIARQRGVDLVMLSGAVDPPLCRLVAMSDYVDDLDRKAAQQEDRARQRRLREFSLDPSMKIKGMRFAAVIAEHDLERKVNQVREFLEKGHRVEARIIQGRSTPEDVLDLGLRIIAEIRDIAKPEFFEESIRELRLAINSPKSLKRVGKAAPDELRLRLWPCTPEQAAAFKLPAHVLGPRRRKGPMIAGIDEEQDEDAWKLNRKPRTRKKGFEKRDLVQAAEE